jgi:hypothetical protein
MDKAEMLRAPYASADAAFAAIEAAGLNKGNFRIIPSANAGEFLIMELQKPAAPEGKAKAAPKAKAKGEGKPAAKRGLDARLAKQSEAKPEAKAKAKAADDMAAFAEARKLQGKWGKLSQRRWLGDWAQMEAEARKGNLPKAQSASASEAMLACAAPIDKDSSKAWAEASASAFSGIFSANTHYPFRKRICALAALIRAKDEKGLKALEIKEISTTPAMLGKLRDLAIAALAAKADKAEAKAAKHEGNGAAPAAPAP